MKKLGILIALQAVLLAAGAQNKSAVAVGPQYDTTHV